MTHRFLLAVLAAAALAAPSATRAGAASSPGLSLALSVWGGVSRYDVLGLRHGLGEVEGADGKDLLRGSFDTAGGSALLGIGWLDLGFLYEGTLLGGSASSEVFTPLVGFQLVPTARLRIDVLAELGGHRLSDVGAGNSISRETRTVWLPYVGVRPSVSLRLPLGPVRLLLSVTPFARWDLVKRQVSVETSGGAQTHTWYEAGGSTFGLVGGAGVEL